jgi:soluble lytic murein transglycosylase
MATMPQLGARRTPKDTRQIATVDLSAEGRAIEGFGNTALKISEDLMKQQQQEADAASVFAARRKLDDWERSNLYDSQNGAVAKLGRDSFDLPTTIPKSFDEFAGKLGDGITSPRARNAVQEMITSRRDQALNFVDRHTFQQRQVFEEGQFKADIDSSLNRAALLMDAGDSATSAAEVKLAQTRAVGFLKARGKSEEEIAAATRDISSKAAISTINMLLDKDKPTEAEKYLRENAGSMKTEDMLRAQAAVGKAVDARQGLVVAQTVVDKVLKPAVAPTDFGRLHALAGEPAPERLTELVKMAESGGKRYAKDGVILTSTKGAKGEMQVLDSTNKDPGYGVVPARDNSPDERARVGRDYLQAMVREFKGDVPKALAAYNAGPGRVQDAIKAGGDNWLEKLPDETKAYVAKITKQFGEGAGAPTLPTLQSLHEQVRKTIPPDQPQRRKIALDEVTRQYEETLKAKKQGEDENIARGYQWLDQNGGRFSQMPANLRANIPAKDYDNMRNYGVRVAKGDDITDPVVFQKMATDDKWLAGLTDAQFYMHSRQLSQSDQQQMALRRGKLLNKDIPAGQKPTDLDANGVNAILNNRLQQIGLDPTPKDSSSEAQRVGAIRKFVWDGVLQAQQAAGKKFNDAEMSTQIDKMFATNVTFQKTFLGFATGSKESMRLLGMSVGDIPGDVKTALEKDFVANGISKPTDADLLGAYFQLRARK